MDGERPAGQAFRPREVEPALELLEGLVEARAPGAENILLFPDGPVRAHPRFQALLERLGLPRDV